MSRAWSGIILLGLVFQAVPAEAADSPSKPAFEFIDNAAVTISPKSSGQYWLDLSIRNSGLEGEASLKLLSDMDKKCEQATIAVEPATPIKLGAGAVAIAHVIISNVDPPATCYVALVPKEQGNTLVKQVKLSQRHVTSTIFWLLWCCLGLSALVALLTWWVAASNLQKLPLSYKLGSPAWDFAKSWTSTTTVVGAIISTALTLTALPDLTKYASKPGYSVLALLISLVIVVAPFVFVAFRAGSIEKDPANKPTVIYEGSLALFLLSCALTLFASLAQLILLFFLLDEIFVDRHFVTQGVGLLSTAALMIALCAYVGHSMYLTIALQKAADSDARRQFLAAVNDGTDQAAKGRAQEDVKAVKGPPLTWPVL